MNRMRWMVNLVLAVVGTAAPAFAQADGAGGNAPPDPTAAEPARAALLLTEIVKTGETYIDDCGNVVTVTVGKATLKLEKNDGAKCISRIDLDKNTVATIDVAENHEMLITLDGGQGTIVVVNASGLGEIPDNYSDSTPGIILRGEAQNSSGANGHVTVNGNKNVLKAEKSAAGWVIEMKGVGNVLKTYGGNYVKS